MLSSKDIYSLIYNDKNFHKEILLGKYTKWFLSTHCNIVYIYNKIANKIKEPSYNIRKYLLDIIDESLTIDLNSGNIPVPIDNKCIFGLIWLIGIVKYGCIKFDEETDPYTNIVSFCKTLSFKYQIAGEIINIVKGKYVN